MQEPVIPGVFREAVVNPIVVKVGNVVTNEAPQVLFVHGNHVVQHFPPTASHPSLSDTVLPRCPDTRSFGLQSRCLQQGDHLVTEYGIVIKDHVLMRRRFGEGLAQLLDNPVGSRVPSDVAVQDLATSMLDDKETVQQLEGH